MKGVKFFMYSLLVAGALKATAMTIKAVKKHKAKKAAKTEMVVEPKTEQK